MNVMRDPKESGRVDTCANNKWLHVQVLNGGDLGLFLRCSALGFTYLNFLMTGSFRHPTMQSVEYRITTSRSSMGQAFIYVTESPFLGHFSSSRF